MVNKKIWNVLVKINWGRIAICEYRDFLAELSQMMHRNISWNICWLTIGRGNLYCSQYTWIVFHQAFCKFWFCLVDSNQDYLKHNTHHKVTKLGFKTSLLVSVNFLISSAPQSSHYLFFGHLNVSFWNA